jgi:glyoxylase-like metal-dependent hydrolase (beta-lactamase superfamily II)
MRTPKSLEILVAASAVVYGCGGSTDGDGTGEPPDVATSSGNPELVQPSEWWTVHPRPVYETLEMVGTYQEWFDVYRLGEGTYALYEPNQFEEAISYLVEGSERAVLIDTGNGIGDIREVAEALTDLPISVILTHEHYDHVAGAWHFDEITAYDNEASLARLAEGRSNESLQRYVTDDYLWKPLPEAWDPSTWTIPPLTPTKLVTDGDLIDLGGRTLEVIYTPGHSPGSMCLLDREHRLLFTGDHFFPGPLYAYPEDVVLEDYIASNGRLVKRLDEFDWLLSGHNDPWVSSEVLPRVSEAFATILAGGGEYSEGDGLRRYRFEGFDVLIRGDMVGGRGL